MRSFLCRGWPLYCLLFSLSVLSSQAFHVVGVYFRGREAAILAAQPVKPVVVDVPQVLQVPKVSSGVVGQRVFRSVPVWKISPLQMQYEAYKVSLLTTLGVSVLNPHDYHYGCAKLQRRVLDAGAFALRTGVYYDPALCFTDLFCLFSGFRHGG
jgi:hypothetical protein